MKIIDLPDPQKIILENAFGRVCLCPNLQGRIFAEYNEVLVHRFDSERANRPSESDFNNLGGNSLWPAPEGGPFGFNYRPFTSDWYVQEGINRICCRPCGPNACEKEITLVNRKNESARIRMRREIGLLPTENSIAYRTIDSIVRIDPAGTDDFPFAAWSLEQFPGADGILAFGRVKGSTAKEALNPDYYGNPFERLTFQASDFRFRLGGPEKLQIGIGANGVIGAWDPHRKIRILRRCAPGNGVRINIADNEQNAGIHSAHDHYSIFNGGPLNFFELETIAPMTLDSGGRVTESILISETEIGSIQSETEEFDVFQNSSWL